MADLIVSILLPYQLQLSDGEYKTPAMGGSVLLEEMLVPRGGELPPEARTQASAAFEIPVDAEVGTKDQKRRHQANWADRLLRRTNHLLRWYRAISRQAQITEVTRAEASPFRFIVSGSQEQWSELVYESAPILMPPEAAGMTHAITDGLASTQEPPVELLNLLDAEYATHTGRFREAVLFCWSAIDSTFGRKYEKLVDQALHGDWSDARKFFRGHADIPLRIRMTAVMHFVANRSLFREPDHFWDDLSSSYDRRNRIVHDGETATEMDARTALDIARRVVAIMEAIPAD